MCKHNDIKVDVSRMKNDALLKMFEMEWQDHFQTRKQTWMVLQAAVLLSVAIVGIQWTAANSVVGIFSSILLIGISLFGMQITLRHRNSVEVTKFTVIYEIEKHLGLKSSGLKVPNRISVFDIFKFCKSNTSLFLLRMQLIIFTLGLIMLVFFFYKLFT